jgi:hypothetical protein
VRRAIRRGDLVASRLGARGAYRILARAADAWFGRSVVEPAPPLTAQEWAGASALGPPRPRPRPLGHASARLRHSGLRRPAVFRAAARVIVDVVDHLGVVDTSASAMSSASSDCSARAPFAACLSTRCRSRYLKYPHSLTRDRYQPL